MRIRISIVALLLLASVTAAQQADDKAALAPFVNEATMLIERYDLTKFDPQILQKWLLQVVRSANTPKQSEYVAYLEKSNDLIPGLIKLLDQLKAAGATRVYVVGTVAVLNDPPAFVLIPLKPNVDAQKIMSALQTLAPDVTDSPREPVVQQIRGAIVVAARVAIAGLQTMHATDRPDLFAAMQAAGDVHIAGGIALDPNVAMIFEQTIPTIPILNRPTSDITRNLRYATIAGTLGDSPALTVTAQATNPEGAQILGSAFADLAKLAATAQPPRALPQPRVNNDTLKLEFTGDSLATIVLAMIDARIKSQLVDTMTRIRIIIQICYTHKYNVEKGDKSWPSDLDVLVKSKELKAEMLQNPRFPDQHPGFIYIRPPENLGEGKSGTTVVLYESVPPGTPQLGVGFVDGHAEIMNADYFDKLLQETKQAAPQTPK